MKRVCSDGFVRDRGTLSSNPERQPRGPEYRVKSEIWLERKEAEAARVASSCIGHALVLIVAQPVVSFWVRHGTVHHEGRRVG